jgi:hypothetical protein
VASGNLAIGYFQRVRTLFSITRTQGRLQLFVLDVYGDTGILNLATDDFWEC